MQDRMEDFCELAIVAFELAVAVDRRPGDWPGRHADAAARVEMPERIEKSIVSRECFGTILVPIGSDSALFVSGVNKSFVIGAALEPANQLP